MERNLFKAVPTRDAVLSLSPGPLIQLRHSSLTVDIAPKAGGRIAQISTDGDDWLIGHDYDNQASMAWGSYPMLPWAGRIRQGRFAFQDRQYQLSRNHGEHALHGLGFAIPWQVDERSPTHIELSLRLPEDDQWPFGGSARQLIQISDDCLRMTLTVSAGAQAMPACLGWHPWFRKPARLEFEPRHMYPRDAEGIACLPLSQPGVSPWDDCFLNDNPVRLDRLGQTLTLTSSCDHWVVYDETAHATCVEPQSGPPDAFNLDRFHLLLPGASLTRWFQLDWQRP